MTKSKIEDGLIKYLLAAVLIFVPLYSKFPFISVPGTFVSIRVEDFLLGILGVVLLFAERKKVKEILRDKVRSSIIIYLFVGFVSTVSAIFVSQTVEAHIAVLHLLRRVEYLVPFFAGYYAIKKNPKNLNFYFQILLIVIFCAFFYGVGQKHLGWPIILTQNLEYSKGIALRWIPGSHINSTFAGHYDLASYLLVVLPIFITGIFVIKGKLSKIALIMSSFAGIWLMANAVSRISIAAYLLCVTISLCFVKKYIYIPIVILVSIFIFGMTSNVITRYDRIYEVVKVRLFSQVSETFVVHAEELKDNNDTKVVVEDRSSSIRFNVEWPRAIRAFKKNPLLGTGYSSITLATDNDYLRLLGETGLFGFLSFMLIFVFIFVELIRRFPLFKHFSGIELAFVAGIISAIPGVLVNAVFIDVFEASKFAILYWLLLGMLIALIRKVDTK